MSFIKVSLEGDFLEVFLYSGILFTVDTKGLLTTCNFKELIENYMVKNNFKNSNILKKYILNENKVKQTYLGENIELNIDKDFINKNCTFNSVPLNVWPTDLDIKSNTVYISSERGVDIIPFEWKVNSISFPKEIKNIWDDTKVFNLSTGSWGRTILAAGKEGAIEIFNIYDKYYNNVINDFYQKPTPKIIANGTWLECDWGYSKILVLKNFNEQKAFLFENTAKQDTLNEMREEKNEKYEQSLEELIMDLDKDPKYINLTDSFIVQYSINNGEIIGLDNSGDRYKYNISNNSWVLKKKIHNNCFFEGNFEMKFISSGIVMERNEVIYIDKMNNIDEIENDFIKWRVFPRSKNYINHMVIVKDSVVDVYAF